MHIPRDPSAGKEAVIITAAVPELLPSSLTPPLWKARKNPPTPDRPPLDQPLRPPSARKTRKPPARAPARRALPPPPPHAGRHAPGRGASAPGPRQGTGTPPMITAAHSGGRRRCLCFQPPHDTAFRSDRQGVRLFGIFSRGSGGWDIHGGAPERSYPSGTPSRPDHNGLLSEATGFSQRTSVTSKVCIGAVDRQPVTYSQAFAVVSGTVFTGDEC